MPEAAVVNFTDAYRRGLANGTFSTTANLSVTAKDGDQTVACPECGIENAVEHLLNGTRAAAKSYNDNTSNYNLTLSALDHLGCFNASAYWEDNSSDIDCSDKNATVDNPELFPFLSPLHRIVPQSTDDAGPEPLKCAKEEVGLTASVIEAEPWEPDIIYGRPELSSCFGLGDLGNFGTDLVPLDPWNVLGRCEVEKLSSVKMTCASDGADLHYVFNVDPHAFGNYYPHCGGSGLVCAEIGAAWAEEQVESYTEKTVWRKEIEIGLAGCSAEAVDDEAAQEHDRMHSLENSAFLVTFSPYYCHDSLNNLGRGYAGRTINEPINAHASNPDDNPNPTAIWMWDGVSPWISPHEFGHAFNADHKDGRCTETGALSPHPFRPHATHMVFSSAHDATEQCGGWPIWSRHLHAEFTSEAQDAMIPSVEEWTSRPETLHK